MAEEEKKLPATETQEEEEDDEHGCKERVVLKYFLLEWETVKALLDAIVSNGRVADPSTVGKIRSIVDKYQEQGQLLEPYLESIVCPLMHIVRSKTIQLGVASEEILEIIKPICIIIYSLVTVCGYKTVIKFFPHQVSDLELAVSLLEKCHHETAMTSLRQESTGEMETKCIILLWLSILVLIPFDISSVDTSIANRDYDGGLEPSPLVLRILGFSKDYLSSAGPMRRIAGLLLSRLLTRPDMPKAFSSFVEWTHEVLSSSTDNVVDHFRLLGTVEALAAIFKVGSRQVLLGMIPVVWNDASSSIKSTAAVRSSLLRKFLVKLTQRTGLACLPHRSSSWHYLGRSSLLRENVLSNLDTNTYNDSSSHGQDVCPHEQTPVCLEEDEGMDVPEIIEEMIELLLSGLRDMDTVVRWSSAKGIGRITARLTSALSDEVLSSILELFSPGEGDSSWHGGCLALAELARRGLLLPARLPKVVPVIIKALHYDIRRGPHSVGSHVRDAAAYVCWAFGRAYSHTDMKCILEQLAPHLLTVACYDREVNCRRAAAAAFQENVGRQGSFPHGIDIVSTADYFSLASRVNSYLIVAVCLAQYEGYLYPFTEELLVNKICHWDKGLRELASQGLSCLAKYDLGYFADVVLKRLIPCTLSTDLCMRHGATLAAGELILALSKSGFMLSDQQKSIAGIVPAIEKARLYCGKGGEIMRSSVSRLIECMAVAQIFLPEKIKRSLLDTINENLRHPNVQIQVSAVAAVKHFVATYLSPTSNGSATDITLKYLELLGDPNVAARRGSALAIGVLPFEFLAVRWRDVIEKLCNSCLIEENPDDRDAEARVNAVRGLVSVCETLAKEKSSIFQNIGEDLSLHLLIKNKVMSTLFKALDDYSVDNRGDVGSWVREAAMDGLERCTYILCERQFVGFSSIKAEVENSTKLLDNDVAIGEQTPFLFDESLSMSLVGGIVKQAVEKIDKIRDTAGKIICRILYNPRIFIPSIPYREILEEIVPNDAGLKWGVPSISYPRFVLLLELGCYSKSVLSGLVISIGGLQDSLRKASIEALLDYLNMTVNETPEKRSTREQMLSSDILWVLRKYEKCDRVIIPTLKTIDIFLNRKIFLNVEGHTEDFATGILDCLAFELKGSKDFLKLYTGISILGYIASDHGTTNFLAFSRLLFFLGHRYPKIRKAAADQVYLVLLQSTCLVAEDKMEGALETITETCWDGDLEEAKNKRLRLYELAGLEVGSLPKGSIRKSDKDVDIRTKADENESYSSLVDSTGF